MRLFAVLCTYAVLASGVLAEAGTRRTREAVVLRKAPGEQAPVVARLAAGTEVTVLAIAGRWLRVRAGGLEGYLTRTTVSSPEPGDAAPIGRWSAGHQLGEPLAGERGVQVAADRGTLRSGPDSASAPVGELPRGEHGARPGQVAVRAGVSLGVRALGMDLSSNATGGLANYVLDTSAPAGTLEIDAAIRPRAELVVGGDARLSASTASPGITYPGPSAPAGTIAFRTVAGDVGARIGARVRRGVDVALRLGAHYDAFVTGSVRNAGMLPRERLLGATLGARVDIVPDDARFAITGRFDALAVGGRAQTEGLEDGTASTARALWGGLAMRYAIGHRLAVFGGYEFGRAWTEWSGMSARQPGATHTRRTDTTQLIQIGISREL